MDSDLLTGWETLRSDNYLVLDFETDSEDHYGVAQIPENRLVLACWKRAADDVPFARFAGEFSQSRLLDAVAECDYIVAHNAKYELGWLRRMGMDLSTISVACTELAEHVLLGNLGTGDKHNVPLGLALNACVKRRGGKAKDPIVDSYIKSGVLCSAIPRPWLLQRCAKDVADTEKLWLSQRAELLRAGKLPILWTRGTLTSTLLAEIESQAVCLDKEAVQRTLKEYEIRLVELTDRFEQKFGAINWRSPKQICDLLYSSPDEGGLGFTPIKHRGEDVISSRKDVVAQLKATNAKQREFVTQRSELSRVGNAISKSLQFYDGVVSERDCTFRAELNQTRAATHRLSSSGIPQQFKRYPEPKSAQLQNQARAFKVLFRARQDDWLVGNWDGSAIEFRVAGHLSRDPQILQDVVSGHDVHKFTAAVIHHAPMKWLKDIDSHMQDIEDECMPKVTDEERSISKAHTFKPVYGGQSGTPREKAYYAAFRQRYSVLADAQEKWVVEVLRSKKLRTEWGLEFYWPRAYMNQEGYIPVATSVYNYPIQCLATGEIIPIAAAYFWHEVIESGLRDKIIPVNEVHDSVVSDVHPSAVDEYFRISRQVWHNVYDYLREVYGMDDFFVPLGTEITVGHRWGGEQLRTEKWNIYPQRKEVQA